MDPFKGRHGANCQPITNPAIILEQGTPSSKGRGDSEAAAMHRMAHASQRKSTKNGIFSGYLLAPIAVQLTWVASTHIKRQAKERKTCQNPTAICFKTKQERNTAASKEQLHTGF
jgi:hypothetical protein